MRQSKYMLKVRYQHNFKTVQMNYRWENHNSTNEAADQRHFGHLPLPRPLSTVTSKASWTLVWVLTTNSDKLRDTHSQMFLRWDIVWYFSAHLLLCIWLSTVHVFILFTPSQIIWSNMSKWCLKWLSMGNFFYWTPLQCLAGYYHINDGHLLDT